MKTMYKRIFALLLVVGMLCSLAAVPAGAATVEDATIKMGEKCNLTIYKYDFTNAAKDGIWTQTSYVSTGQYDANVNNILGAATREGDTDSSSALGSAANGASNGYAIKGVEFTYLKVANVYQFSESENDDSSESAHVEVLYQFDKTKAAALLSAIGLADGAQSYAPANALDATSWYYRSDVLNAALKASLAANATTVKNALEAYVKNGGTAMGLTDEDGRTIATGLEVGLYLLVETKTPEMVTSTCAPFFVSLPMTNVNGGGDGVTGGNTQVTNGGSEWLYDVTVYPKNETGIVTLEKTVREAKADTATHGGSTTDITDGYKHYATASTGDVVEYQIISTLPTITSAATYITQYTFQDILARGMSYVSPVKIEWFKNATCLPADLVATWTVNDATRKFNAVETKNDVDGSHTLTISMTPAGLNEINTANTSANNSNGSLYAGYSNYTVRITYSAKLNSDESMVYGDAGNPNEVVLTWARTSSNYLDTLIDDCHIFTYGMNLTKEFSDEKTEQELFDDVLFIAQNKTDGYFVQAQLNENEGIWYVTGHTTKESSATKMHPVDWNGKDGQLVVKGLEDDEYILTEVQTADSYTLLKENISLVISTKDDSSRPCGIYGKDKLGVIQNDSRFNFDGCPVLQLANIPQAKLAHNMLTASATVDENAVVMINDEADKTSTNALATLRVVNTKGFNLPQTGETTATMMPIIGGTMLGISVMFILLLFVLRRKQEEN